MDNLPGVEPLDLNKSTTVGDLIKRGYKSHMDKPLASRRRGSMIAGAIIGGLTSDDWGNSFTGTAIDAGIGAGVGAAVTHAADYIQNHYGKPIGDFLTEGVKVSDIAKGEVERDAVKTVEKMNSVFRGQNKIAMGIAAIIGIGTVASVSNDLHHETKVERMKDDEEKQNTRKENKQKELMSRYYGWNQSIDMGQMAIDMFNDRIGHHLMGNSKFK